MGRHVGQEDCPFSGAEMESRRRSGMFGDGMGISEELGGHMDDLCSSGV